MGTSVSQRSPSTPNWQAVALAYSNESIPLDRTVREIWRAATNQPEGNLGVDLSEPIIAKCLSIVSRANTSSQAIQDAKRAIALSGETSLAADIAQRAIVQCFSSSIDRTDAFVQSLFGEATNYLVSRDLSGFIGKEWRSKTVSDAISFKENIQRQTISRVASVKRPNEPLDSPATWQSFVTDVVNHLAGGRR